MDKLSEVFAELGRAFIQLGEAISKACHNIASYFTQIAAAMPIISNSVPTGGYLVDQWGHWEYWSFTTSTGTLITYPVTTSSSTTGSTVTVRFEQGGTTGDWYEVWPQGGNVSARLRDDAQFIPATDDEVAEYARTHTAGDLAEHYPPRTPNEEAARARRATARQVEQDRRRAARTTARNRSEETLLSFLDPEQRAAYLEHGHFDVLGSAGGRYRINKGNSGNVVYLDPVTHLRAGTLCAHPSMDEAWLPDPDVALAQMLALMTDEPNFCGIANVHWGVRPPCADMEARERNRFPRLIAA